VSSRPAESPHDELLRVVFTSIVRELSPNLVAEERSGDVHLDWLERRVEELACVVGPGRRCRVYTCEYSKVAQQSVWAH
jgi:hypothetical protein